MSGVALMRRMARNNAWANSRLLEAAAALGEAGFAARRDGFFRSIRGTLVHNLQVDAFYLDALEGNPNRDMRDLPADEWTVAALTEAQSASDARLIRFCDGLAEADLDRETATDRGAEGMLDERIGDLLLHLFQHQIHHRGQAHNMLSQAGAPPPQLDEFHLRYDRHPTAAGFDD